MPLPSVIVERLGQKESAFIAPLFVASPNIGDTQIEEAIHSVEIGRCFVPDPWLIGSRATAAMENDPGIGQLDVAGIFRLDHFSAKNADVEVL